LYAFDGSIEIAKRTYNLNYEQMLLKGTQLTNTEWIIGFVAYTGKETRIMMNSFDGKVK
jgi:magnesium-transporting ATPase (P-type)